jgi:hypothetical protein
MSAWSSFRELECLGDHLRFGPTDLAGYLFLLEQRLTFGDYLLDYRRQ